MRVSINFEDTNVAYKTIIPVLVNHLNYGNHLGYDSMLSIIQEARMRFLRDHKMGEKNIDGNIGYLIADVALSYKSEAFHGDELEVMLSFSNVNRSSCDAFYKVSNTKSSKIVALAKTGLSFYDFELKKNVRIPESFLKIIEPSLLYNSPADQVKSSVNLFSFSDVRPRL